MTPEQEQRFKFRARAEAEQQAAAATPVAEDETTRWADFKRGMGESVLKTTLGLKELATYGADALGKGQLGQSAAQAGNEELMQRAATPVTEDPISPVERQAMQMLKEDVDASGGWGTGGRVAGEVLQLAIPATKVSALNKTMGGGARSLLAADTALGGAHGATKLPGQGQSRTDSAIKEAAATATGGVAGRMLGKTVEGLARTDAGHKLLEKGVELTPAQSLRSVFPKAAEYAMQITPFVARGVTKAKERATDSWNKVVLDSVSPLGKEITESGTQGIKQLKNHFTAAYKDAWGKATKPSNEALVDMVNSVSMARDELGGSSGATLKGILGDIKNMSQAKDTGVVLRQLDNTLRKKIESAAKAGDDALETVLRETRDKLRASAGSDVTAALKPIDAKYGEWVAVRDAGSMKSVMEAGGRMEPTQLMGGVKSAGGRTRAATGDAPLYDITKQGVDTIGQKSPNPLIDLLKGLSVNTPTLFPLKKAGQAITGRTATQKAIQVPYRSATAEALRDMGVRGSILGGQTIDER